MNKLKYEAYQVGVYCDTVYMILKEHSDLSIAKIIFFTYAINKERFINKNIYNAKNTQKILSKEISTINGDFEGYANAVPYIIKAIHILVMAKKITVQGNIAHLLDENYQYVKCNRESKFAHNVIEKSKTWSDIRFLREVLHNV